MTSGFATPARVDVNARPDLHDTEVDAIVAALADGQYGHGVWTDRFEEDVARHLGVADVVAVSSGTAALHIALLAAGIGPGDEVIVPSLTFCATIQAILAVGAHPRFVEVDPTTLCADAPTVLAALGPATRAVLPVLYGGRAVDLTGIQDALDQRGIVVIEDAAQAFGSHLGHRPVGATGLLTCFSFGPIKNLTCLEGGAVVPRTKREAAAVRRLRLLGITQPQTERVRATTYQVAQFGLRATMSAVHAAVGSAQLARFPAIAAQRKDLWRAYAAALHDIPGVHLVDVDVEHTVPFNCVIRIPHRDTVHQLLQQAGIGVGVHYPPNHLQPAFTAWRRHLPVTENVGRQILSLPFHPHLDHRDVRQVARALRGALHTVSP